MFVEKYSGSGNDFLITHFCVSSNLAKLAKKLCDRHFGIGADGLIVLKPHANYAYEWLFFNSDGSQASMCGNASRCVGHYAFKHRLAQKKHCFWAGERMIKIHVKSNNIVATCLGEISKIQKLDLKSSYNTIAYKINTGVPHLVIFTDSLNKLPQNTTEELKNIRQAVDANINIVYIKDRKTLQVHTYERGVENITLACGTGMAAASAVYHSLHKDSKSLICIPPSKEKLLFTLKGKGISFEGKVYPIATCQLNL